MAANPFQQQARLRKLIYTAIIVVLFTASLLYRKQIVVQQANDLQLLETSRGEVELTSSALRLILTGSRGLAVTALWKAAIDEQTRHKWNEVELLVGSITKLQPYFITPWLFQSWNMSFNVSVECDKPRDKYYYVSRGLQLLAEGERRNQGLLDKEGRPRFPGNPDMRHNLGFFYKLKIGTSDEKNAMQSLLYMSTIDPVERDPETLWAPGKQGRDVDLNKFAKFCRDHPRFVRRLNDALDYTTPKAIVGFLKDNQTIPTRFSEKERHLSGASKLLERTEQFPILPPKVASSTLPVPLQGFWPDPESANLTSEVMDAFVVARSWFSYAQLPLPVPEANIGAVEPTFNPLKERLPKHMTTIIFRGYPSLAQEDIAVHLQKEGWFDEDGWVIRDWFDSLPDADEFRVGVEPKYHSGPAWKKAHELYRDLGIKNGLYITPEARAELRNRALAYQKRFRVSPGGRDLHPELRAGAMADSYKAHQKLAWNDHYRNLTNYDAHLYESETEQDSRAIHARKGFFNAKQLGRAGAIPQALASYEAAIPVWLELLLDYPRFRRVQSVQEDLYEAELKYLYYLQRDKAATLRNVSMLFAQLGCWPNLPPFDTPFDRWLSDSQKLAIIPIRMFFGPLDRVVLFDVDYMLSKYPVPSQEESYDAEFKRVVLTWSQMGLPFPMLVYPGQQGRQLSHAAIWPTDDPRSAWLPIIPVSTIDMVRQRMNLPSLSPRRPGINMPPPIPPGSPKMPNPGMMKQP